MATKYLVRFSAAPNRDKRFAIVFSGTYSSLSDLKFVDLSTAFNKGVSLDLAKRIVEDALALAAQGYPEAWIASAEVCTYHVNETIEKRFRRIYPEAAVGVAPEPELPAIIQIYDAVDQHNQPQLGTWRAVPLSGWTKGVREWKYGYALMLRSGAPWTEEVSGKSQADILSKLVSPGFVPGRMEHVKSWPFASPEQIAAATVTPSAAEPLVKHYPQDQINAARTRQFSEPEWKDEIKWYNSLTALQEKTLYFSDKLAAARMDRIAEIKDWFLEQEKVKSREAVQEKWLREQREIAEGKR